ncbi:cytochrome ubiquinol oxidase subunit I [Tumebacillus flagellatus]|uniref:Cytochrome D ubiquinol oxidase subunit I n=1 Tax=Tumebacillus flagellatus TaxID=1157490 RepID=A0A074LJX6_9BACL|nr:cytochrome ubiquinol oxidase subunit I [Tumebacillus flagellatus]KEO82471.1 cytochrome D ubiquinol oxidase subunit I [Tumebacillus flagellatus]
MNLDQTMLARILTMMTLSFHIIFATLGVGMPLVISIAEFLGIRRGDDHYLQMAKRWSKGYTVTVAVGVVTGTCIGLQLSLLWPTFMKLGGDAIALPLFLETFAFFFEAIFLGIYLYSWNRFSNPWIHWALGIPVLVGSSLSAFFIMTVNAFMNAPQGFKLQDGKIVDVQPILAMFNPATPTKAGHMILSAWATTAFVLACLAAYRMLKGNKQEYVKKALRLTMVLSLVFSSGTALYGDLAGKYLAKHQPEKLAAAEWHFDTGTQASLVLGGVLNEQTHEISYGVKIPYLLSFLATGSPTGEVKGLNEVAKDLQPPLFVHYLFDAMAGIGSYMVLVPLLYFLWTRKRGREVPKGLMRLIVWGGPLAMLAIQLGWVFSEVGRQPWILVGYLKTGASATTSAHVGSMVILFGLLYVFLGVAASRVLLRMFRNNPIPADVDQGREPHVA